MHFASLFAFSSFVIASLALPLSTVSDSINGLSISLNGITTSVGNLPSNPTLEQVGAIHIEAVKLEGDVDKSAQTIAALPKFSKSESDTDLTAAQGLVAAAEKVLDTIVAHKASFKNTTNGNALPLVIKDVKDLGTKGDAWADTIISHADPSDVSAAESLKSTLKSKFTTTVAALEA
ncbi:hypothetical protein H0H92_015681 [Tricholoma furcatifolium]|nr:hypothetical protein H0H92_015681 [Tricholoma furcatifolium]